MNEQELMKRALDALMACTAEEGTPMHEVVSASHVIVELRAALAAPVAPAEPMTDAQLDALDTFALAAMAPRGRESVRQYARAVLASRAAPVTPAAPARFAERDDTRTAEAQGLFRKFEVRRVDGSDKPGGKHHGCAYFVLDMDHDAHAPAALRAYAEACNGTHPQLAADLLARFPDPVAPADDWRQYATEREDTAQQVIERHRAEQDALLKLLADARRQIAPVAPAEPVPHWLPIDTAPQDGRTILLGRYNERGKWRTMRGQWMSQDCIDETWEDPEAGEPGWFETCVEADEIPNCWPINPTHWQPLPAPPEKTA